MSKRSRMKSMKRSYLKRFSSVAMRVPARVADPHGALIRSELKHAARAFDQAVNLVDGFRDRSPKAIWQSPPNSFMFIKVSDYRSMEIRMYFGGSIWFFIKHDKMLDRFNKSIEYHSRTRAMRLHQADPRGGYIDWERTPVTNPDPTPSPLPALELEFLPK